MQQIPETFSYAHRSNAATTRRGRFARAVLFGVGAAALLPHARAQSSVSLTGLFDGGVTAQTHSSSAAGHNYKAVSGSVWNPSQLNIKGVEDLGGGTTAFFALGSTFLLNSGSALSKFYDRNSYVGIADPVWGTLTLGRQVSALADTIYIVDPFSTHNSSNNMNSRFGYVQSPGSVIAGNFGPTPSTAPGIGLDRVDNSIKYAFRSTTGLVGNVMAGAANGVGGRAEGGMIGYDGSALTARASYMEYRDIDGVPFKALASGATYQLSNVMLRVSYIRNKIDSSIDTPAKPYRNMLTQVAGFGGTWTIDRLDLNAALYRGSRTQDNQPQQVAWKLHLAPEYRLSKRTSVTAVAVLSKFNDAGSALDPSVLKGSTRSTYIGSAISHRF